MSAEDWDTNNVMVADSNIPDSWKVCYIQSVFSGNDHNGSLGALPLLAVRFKRLRIPLYAYLFARYFGTGVVVATAYVHLMDPEYAEIGPNACVGMTGNWSLYSWPPAIMLTSKRTRLSAILWPKDWPSWIPGMCCIPYGLVTPVCIAVGLGVRTTYSSNSFNANIVQGALGSISAGILMYTGLVELLARDFIFDDKNTKDLRILSFSIVCTLVGAGVMTLLGKWT